MHLHVIRHVPFEGPGRIERWATSRGHTITEQPAITQEYPPAEQVDFLVLMGGPMAADDHGHHPWLAGEKAYTRELAHSGRLVLGVCLGAQIIADALGGAVKRNPQREIGWYPVARTAAAQGDPVFSAFPDGLVVGHWHGDTFELPAGVEASLSSEACLNQGFSAMEGRVVGLQFHLEWDAVGLGDLMEQCADELVKGGAWVSDAADILEGAENYLPACEGALFDLLDNMARAAEER